MSFLSTIENLFSETEIEVIALVVAVKKGESVVASDIDKAIKWVVSETPAIVANLQGAVALVEEVGVASNPDVAIAITAANAAVTALNAFAAASNSGSTDAQAIVQGYVAVKQAQASAASAAAAAASVPTPASKGT